MRHWDPAGGVHHISTGLDGGWAASQTHRGKLLIGAFTYADRSMIDRRHHITTGVDNLSVLTHKAQRTTRDLSKLPSGYYRTAHCRCAPSHKM